MAEAQVAGGGLETEWLVLYTSPRNCPNTNPGYTWSQWGDEWSVQSFKSLDDAMKRAVSIAQDYDKVIKIAKVKRELWRSKEVEMSFE